MISNPFTHPAGWTVAKYLDAQGQIRLSIEIPEPLKQFDAWGLSNVLNKMTNGDEVKPLPVKPSETLDERFKAELERLDERFARGEQEEQEFFYG